MITLPITGLWKVAHGRKYFADIVRSKNMDFNTPGFARLARKPIALYNSDSDSNFGDVVSILDSGNSYYVITTDHVYVYTPGDHTVVEVTSTSMPEVGLWSDGVMFDDNITISGEDTVHTFASSWTSRITGLSSLAPHPLASFENRVTLCVGDGNLVRQYSTSWVEDTTNKLTIPDEYVITGLRWRQNNLYIATRTRSTANAKMFIWNGAGTTAQYAYGVNADWIYSMAEFDSAIYCITSGAQLLRFNGGGFDEKAVLPVYNTQFSWVTTTSNSSLVGRVANRGMQADGGVLYINLDGSLTSSGGGIQGRYLADQPSGLWIFDPDVGLHHHAGYVPTVYRTETPTFGSSIFTFSSAHNLATAEAVFVASVGTLTGITAGQIYFAIIVSSTSVKLALSESDALAGRYISVEGSGGASLSIDTFDAFGGQMNVRFPGGIAVFSQLQPNSFFGSTLLYGGLAIKGDNTQVAVLLSLGVGRNIGSFVTSPIPAAGVTDSFKKLYVFLDNILLDMNEAVVKYRKVNRLDFPTRYRYGDSGMATWVNTTTFTVNSAYKPILGMEVDDEIEFIEGAGAGYTAHILSFSNVGTTYTIVLDEAITGVTASQKSEFIIDNWTKTDALTRVSPDSPSFGEVSLGKQDTWIQFKVELRGRGTAVRKLTSASESRKPAT